MVSAAAIVLIAVGLMIGYVCRRLRQPHNNAETPPSDRICEDNPSGENDDNVDRGNGGMYLHCTCNKVG